MTPLECPKGCDLTGEKIPEKYKDLYGETSTHSSRVFGHYDTYEDRTVLWECPDCGIVWSR